MKAFRRLSRSRKEFVSNTKLLEELPLVVFKDVEAKV